MCLCVSTGRASAGTSVVGVARMVPRASRAFRDYGSTTVVSNKYDDVRSSRLIYFLDGRKRQGIKVSFTEIQTIELPSTGVLMPPVQALVVVYAVVASTACMSIEPNQQPRWL